MSLPLMLSTSLFALFAGRLGAGAGPATGKPAPEARKLPVTMVIVKAVDLKAEAVQLLTLVPSVCQRTVTQGWYYSTPGGRNGQKRKIWRRRTVWVPSTRWEERSLPLRELEFHDLQGNKLGRPEVLQRLRPGQAALLQARSIPQGAETTATVGGMLVLVTRDSEAAAEAAKQKRDY